MGAKGRTPTPVRGRAGRGRTAVLCILVALAPAPTAAQVRDSFDLLPLRVNLGDRVRIEDQSRVTTTGRVERLTREEIALQTGSGERRFASTDVREVAVRGYRLRRSALIGAGALAVVSTVTVCTREDHDNCALAGLAAAPIGAGLGLIVGSLVPQMKTVYRAPEPGAAVAAPTLTRAGETSLLADLGLRLNLDDEVEVDAQSGTRIVGRVVRLTADEIALRTAAGEQPFTRADLRRVAVRRRPLRKAVLIGGGVGAVAGVLAGCTGDDREECPDAWLITGGLGAGIGLGVGALLPRASVVFPAGGGSRISVAPVLTRDRVAVRVIRQW